MKAENKSDYVILGVSSRATKSEITKAYRKLALQTHPDKHSPRSELLAREAFQVISSSYEKVKDR